MKRLIVGVLLVFALASPARAQAITSWTLTITNQSTSVSTTSTLTGYVCGQPKLVTGVVINPRGVQVDDPANGALACVWMDPGTGPLATLPFAATSYIATLMFNNSVGPSPPSPPSLPFTRPGSVPGAPTNLRTVKLILRPIAWLFRA